MSGRQSLLGQSLVRNANALNFGLESNTEKHWKRDWFSPAKPVQSLSSSITPSGTPTPFGDEQTPQEQLYPFKVKTWVLEESYRPVVDGEEEDLLDLDKYSTVKVPESNGLTDKAIRGAVATGGDTIPGISQSTDAATAATAAPAATEDKEEPKGEAKQEEPKEEATIEIVKGPEPEPEPKTTELTTAERTSEAPKSIEPAAGSVDEIKQEETKPEEPIAPVALTASTDPLKEESISVQETEPLQVPSGSITETIAEPENKDADGDVVIN